MGVPDSYIIGGFTQVGGEGTIDECDSDLGCGSTLAASIAIIAPLFINIKHGKSKLPEK